MRALYTNRQLFSDHWLRERLPERDDFELTPLALVRFALWARHLEHTLPAAQGPLGAHDTGERIVSPCLAALGYAPGAWQTVRAGLWPGDDDLVWQLLTIARPDAPAASSVLVASCAWNAPLDDAPVPAATSAASTSRRANSQSPSLRFLRLLATSEAAWGVLSNGRVWRLYHRGGDALEAYYEVDLIALAALDDVAALKYAYLFFAAHAHRATETEGQTFLEVALAESRAYAAGIESDLRERAFDAIAAACQGLAEALAAERGIAPGLLARADLQVVYADALALLYRLLFVLYAESRELLPVRDEVYAAEFSLRDALARLPATISGLSDPHRRDATPARKPSRRSAGRTTLDAATSAADAAPSPAVDGLWRRLSRLFSALNGYESSPHVPAYSGRLFDRDVHPLLARLAVPDIHIARMLVLLGRTKDGRQIDYADLAVRQLGSIYEGLLEHQAIAVATAPMALVRGPKDKVPVVVPRSEAGQRRVLETYPPGTVYLSNDRGERHAMGTYYTPEPVVRYLVTETLGPLVAGKTAQDILRLKILDPAMGSGHFLVAAVDYLARAALAAADASAVSPAAQRSGQAAGDVGDHADVLELKRRIAEQCIYGVDLNESAVELAKLSLWLATAARDRPLTFLDLHLRAGNSLIGLAPGELETAASTPLSAPGPRRQAARPRPAKRGSARPSAPAAQDAAQAELWSGEHFTRDMFLLVGGAQSIDLMATDTVQAVRDKARLLAETIEPRRAPYRRVADLFVSTRFGPPLAAEVYTAAVKHLLDQGGVRLASATLDPALAAASHVRERHHVFHWELEFPEVFRDAMGRPLADGAGFDAILGNPPYVSVTTLRSLDPEACDYYPHVFASASQGKYDLYVAFVERALGLLNARGRLAYILPNKWLTSDFGAPLRELLAARGAVSALLDYGAYPVFPGVSNYTCLLFAGRASHEHVAVFRRARLHGDLDLPPQVGPGAAWQRGTVESRALSAAAWNLTVGGAQAILDRWRDWPTLGSEANIFVGTCTNANPVFIVFERAREEGAVRCYAPVLEREVPLEPGLLRPVLQGRDIAPYAFDDHGARLLFPYALAGDRAALLPPDELRAHAPLAWAYLNQPPVRAILEGREKGRFQGRADWYGFGRPQNMHLLATAKLVLPDVADRGRVAYDAAGHAIVDTAYGILANPASPYAPHFLAAALNSPVLAFFLRHRGSDLRGGYFRMKTAYLNPFPLPPIAWTLPEGARRAQATWGTDRALGAIRAAGETERIAASLAHLSDDVLHDVIAALAEHAATLAERERTAWGRFANVVREHAPNHAADARVAALLAPERGHTLDTPDALLAALGKAGAPLTAPALVAIRAALREARAPLTTARAERETTIRLIDRLVARLYGLSAEDIALVEGREAAEPGPDGVSSTAETSRSVTVSPPRQAAAGRDTEDTMRTVTKGGQPELVLTCIAQALANPYSATADMNQAMGYVRHSSTGPHYLGIGVVAGLLNEMPEGWLRATAAGRRLLLESRSTPAAIWPPLMALPGYRRFLEYQLLELMLTNRARSASLGQQVERAAYSAFPEYRSRAEYLIERLGLSDVSRVLRPTPTLEPVDRTAHYGWMGAQGLGPSRSDLTRAADIATALSLAARQPLWLDATWLSPARLLALLLLIAARERRQGVIVQVDQPTMLSRAVEDLQRLGLDIRTEQQGPAQSAALIPALTLHLGDTTSLLAAARSEDALARAIAEIALDVAHTSTGLDGRERGEVPVADLALAYRQRWSGGVGEFTGHSAAEEMLGDGSSVTIGPSLPLASDLALQKRPYSFMQEAVRLQSDRRAQPGVALLLTPWLAEQQGTPDELLASNPHLALLYLVAADTGGHAERLEQRGEGWLLDGQPLVAALDARLRAVGYEVWDEGYAGRDDATHALGHQLVEQGLRCRLMTRTGDASSPLEAPSAYGYYDAATLLTAAIPTRSAR